MRTRDGRRQAAAAAPAQRFPAATFYICRSSAATKRDIAAVAGAEFRSRVVTVAVIAHLAACAVAALRIASAGRGGRRDSESEDSEQCEDRAFHFVYCLHWLVKYRMALRSAHRDAQGRRVRLPLAR